MSEFDVLKGRIDDVLTKLNTECDTTLGKCEAWKERMRDVICVLGMSIAKLFDGEELKNEIGSSMMALSKVRDEMRETVNIVARLLDDFSRLTLEGRKTLEQGSLEERTLISEGVTRLFFDKIQTASNRVEWLKGFGRAVESYMGFWAKEKDQMEALYQQFERSEAEWDAVGELRSKFDRNPMYR